VGWTCPHCSDATDHTVLTKARVHTHKNGECAKAHLQKMRVGQMSKVLPTNCCDNTHAGRRDLANEGKLAHGNHNLSISTAVRRRSRRPVVRPVSEKCCLLSFRHCASSSNPSACYIRHPYLRRQGPAKRRRRGTLFPAIYPRFLATKFEIPIINCAVYKRTLA